MRYIYDSNIRRDGICSLILYDKAKRNDINKTRDTKKKKQIKNT